MIGLLFLFVAYRLWGITATNRFSHALSSGDAKAALWWLQMGANVKRDSTSEDRVLSSAIGIYPTGTLPLPPGAPSGMMPPVRPIDKQQVLAVERLVHALLERGVLPSQTDLKAFSALGTAINRKSLPIIKDLLEHGADVNTPDAWLPALANAASNDSPEIFSYLLSKGASIEAKSANRETAIWYASTATSDTMQQSLLARRADLGLRNRQGDSVVTSLLQQRGLRLALNSAKLESRLISLVENGADVHIHNNQGETPLSLAAFSPKLVSYLLSKGAKMPLNGSPEDWKLLETALLGGNLALVVSRRDSFRQCTQKRLLSLCLSSAMYGQWASLHWLLRLPLQEETVNLLAQTWGDKVAMEGLLALEQEHHRVEPKYWALALANGVRMHRTTEVKRMLEHGVPPAGWNSIGNTALVEATMIASTDMVELLIKYGADVNEKCKNGRTSLMIAKRLKNPTLRNILLKHGAE